MIHRQARKRLHMRYPMPNIVPPIIHPITWYKHIACIIDIMIPPRNRKDLLCEKSETAENEPKTPVEYNAAWVNICGCTAAK